MLCVWLTAVCLLIASLAADNVNQMTEKERLSLRDEAEDMFFHAYNAYMEVAWPADELMPLSCKGRYRGREVGRGDIDEALGNFSLTLIDSLDMLVVLGRIDEFEQAVLKVVETVRFDTDVVVSVFETNIRIVGGLVSGHVLAEYVRDRSERMSWYSGQLLNMALDVGTRLLPAFNTTTGLPYPRVNLNSGLKGVSNQLQLTCTACAGTMILEFAALSRLSGESIFEEVASKAMDYLWAARHRQSNLVGNVLNVNTGDWVRRDDLRGVE
jgi:mannosidase alpha-like ER degradation enhancer 3